MQCLVVRELLSPYLDGVLSLAEQKEISAHLAVCPSCRAEFEILCDLVNILKDLPELSPSSGFSARVIKKCSCFTA
jgi:predicted anti-sigma-YlaC factor YlaD